MLLVVGKKRIFKNSEHAMFLLRKIHWIVFGVSLALTANANLLGDFAPPKIQLVDEFGVNLASGQVTSHLETVAIGGSMGLSHNISGYTNNFSMTGLYGYQDKFYARSRATVIEDRINKPFLEVLKVHDFSSSADFKVIVNGQNVSSGTNPTTNYTYQALGDARHTLTVASNGNLHWTKPDGTLVKFYRGSTAAWATALMTEVVYPSGFTISIDSTLKNVTTNTGFALKYIYVIDTRGMDAGKPVLPTTQIPPVTPEVWSGRNPKYIQAINTSIESCLSPSVGCTQGWAKATFTWPGGMPRAIYLGDSTFSVEDATGGKTDYFFRGYDLAYSSNIVVSPYIPNERFSPRLIGIKPASSTQQALSYSYKTIFNTSGGSDFYYFYLAQVAGVITNASKIDRNTNYLINQTYYSETENIGSGTVRKVRPSSELPGVLREVETIEGKITYEHTYRNLPTTYIKYSGANEAYQYDLRGNLTKYSKAGTFNDAEYPATCTNPKTCNQPLWIGDAKGNKTWYTYHPESGQVASITYPANKTGLVAQIRYEYEQKTASYYNVGGSLITGSPIWLKTAEKSCANSGYSNGCQGNDEVITRFEYNHDNLLMTGITVYSQQENKTLRTCFQYDTYGNQIGKTEPRANLSSCD